MKITNLIYLILLTFIIYAFNSCNKCEGNEVGPDGRIFSFRLIDPNTNETAIGAWGTKYDYEDVEFVQESKETINGLEIRDNGRFSFFLIDEIGSHNRNNIVDKPFTNTYYLYLNGKTDDNETDIDTIMISSEIVSVDEKCTSIDFGNTTIIYNDSIYHQGDIIRHLDFIKKN